MGLTVQSFDRKIEFCYHATVLARIGGVILGFSLLFLLWSISPLLHKEVGMTGKAIFYFIFGFFGLGFLAFGLLGKKEYLCFEGNTKNVIYGCGNFFRFYHERRYPFTSVKSFRMIVLTNDWEPTYFAFETIFLDGTKIRMGQLREQAVAERHMNFVKALLEERNQNVLNSSLA